MKSTYLTVLMKGSKLHEGTLLKNALCTNAICGPSRASILTALDLPFKFDKNKLAVVGSIQHKESSQSLNLNYPLIKAKLYLSYHALDENLSRYVSETEFTTKNHAKVAHEVTEQKFENFRTNVFGKMYELTGPVASQCQFYVTDSSQHFLTGSLYFKVKPNYDSILPAVRYLQKDMIQLVQSLEWKF